jgi:SAM-dependent methyltransferase
MSVAPIPPVAAAGAASPPAASVEREVLARLSLSARDLPTRDKIPVIRALMPVEGPGLALDIGVGTGYTTFSVFGQRPTVCVDVDTGNLRHYRERVGAVAGARRPLCVAALATALPFRDGAIRFVLCSEVLEHLEDDAGAAAEIARVLAADGAAVITVPYTGIGFTGFLELLGVKTVHDFPGPERHVRPGYDEAHLGRLLAAQGLVLERHRYYFRFFTRLATDLVSAAHIVYQRVVHGRRAWTWADVTASEGSLALRAYARVFPLLWAFSRLDVLLGRWRGFGLVASVRKPGTCTDGRAEGESRP